MKHFLKLVELASEKGILTKAPLRDAKFLPLDKLDIDRFEKCETVVFVPVHKYPKTLNDEDFEGKGSPDFGDIKMDLAAPFEIFCYEMLEGPICSPRITDEIQVYVWAIMVIETGPNQWGFYGLMEEREGDKSYYYVCRTNSFGEITKEYVSRLNTEKVGSESVRTSVKIGTGSLKKQHRIRRIVHVGPKSYVKSLEGTGSKIDFTHRFLVRGHWRKLADGKLGKNRNGDYCVPGQTWVSEFEKGPENMPLVKKTRLVESAQAVNE